MRRIKYLTDSYAFPGFRALHTLQGVFGDPYARIVVLRRRGKKLFAEPAAQPIGLITTTACAKSATCLAVSCVST